MAKRISLRRARLGDVEALQVLLREGDDVHRAHLPGLKRAAEADVPLERLAAWVTKPETLLLVATIDDSVCAFLRATAGDFGGGRLHQPERWVSVDEVVVTARARRQGLARALMGEVPGWAREVGATAAYLNVYDFNRDAIALYHSLGWQDLRRTLRLETD